MSRAVEIEGEKVGRREARRWKKEILAAADAAAVGHVAGKALEDFLARPNIFDSYDLARTDAWRMGFFDGFVQRADEFRR